MTWSLAGWVMRGDLANHLWQSTLVVLVAAGLAWAIGESRARVRHAIWQVASVKFLIPFALLAALGSRLPTTAPMAMSPAPVDAAVLNAMVRPFALGDFGAAASPIAPPGTASDLPALLFVVWACGGGRRKVAPAEVRPGCRILASAAAGPHIRANCPAELAGTSRAVHLRSGPAGLVVARRSR